MARTSGGGPKFIKAFDEVPVQIAGPHRIGGVPCTVLVPGRRGPGPLRLTKEARPLQPLTRALPPLSCPSAWSYGPGARTTN